MPEAIEFEWEDAEGERAPSVLHGYNGTSEVHGFVYLDEYGENAGQEWVLGLWADSKYQQMNPFPTRDAAKRRAEAIISVREKARHA
jgi:hypothetical protein